MEFISGRPRQSAILFTVLEKTHTPSFLQFWQKQGIGFYRQHKLQGLYFGQGPKVDSMSKPGILLEVVQVLTDLDLTITKAYIPSDGGWFRKRSTVLASRLQLRVFVIIRQYFMSLINKAKRLATTGLLNTFKSP
ncbi:Amino acid binding protein [Castilleja foliolosa]|uniref:ACT domain-containing protein ACR n=1 Tax=Castilleja foliolosa TaxID=1961234 RepID=A0ABD3DJT6_9LAMI